MVYLAAAGSKQLAEVRESAGDGKPRRLLQGLWLAIQRALGLGGERHFDLEGMDRADDQDSIPVSLYYAGRLLADAVPVPRGGRVVRVILPYTGGDLVDGGFELRGENVSSTVSAVVLRHDPPLSRTERAALELVPESMLDLHVGAALPGTLLGKNDQERARQEEERRRQQEAAQEARAEQAAARAEAMAEVAAERAERRAASGRDFVPHLRESTVRALPPVATAAVLLQIRRDSLAGPGM
ncbi:MAG TPA: hypothetical protein VHG28_15780 [Longimicrobiaceae bacterium]|nr:hypothetical protein [Longimicrobiaceae bacterium]